MQRQAKSQTAPAAARIFSRPLPASAAGRKRGYHSPIKPMIYAPSPIMPAMADSARVFRMAAYTPNAAMPAPVSAKPAPIRDSLDCVFAWTAALSPVTSATAWAMFLTVHARAYAAGTATRDGKQN